MRSPSVTGQCAAPGALPGELPGQPTGTEAFNAGKASAHVCPAHAAHALPGNGAGQQRAAAVVSPRLQACTPASQPGTLTGMLRPGARARWA